jgi:plastocyanin
MNRRYYFIGFVLIVLGFVGYNYYSSMNSEKISTDVSEMDMHTEESPISTTSVKTSTVVTPTPTTSTTTTVSSAGTITPKTYSISIQGFTFSPKIIEVQVGDTIVWTNKDGAPHTVTSDTGTELASVNLGVDDTYSHTFTKADIFNYHCAIHPGMKATVIVR